MKIRKGDLVQILSGKDKGKRGKVLEMKRDLNKVVVEGLNLRKKHLRSKKQGEPGQIVEFPGTMNISNVGLVCSSCQAVSRVAVRVLESGTKERYCRKCNAVVNISSK